MVITFLVKKTVVYALSLVTTTQSSEASGPKALSRRFHVLTIKVDGDAHPHHLRF